MPYTSVIAKETAAPLIVDPNQRYTLQIAVALLRQSMSKTHKEIRAGSLRVIRDGKRVYIPGTEIIRRSTLAA
jgi:hypothetical protein